MYEITIGNTWVSLNALTAIPNGTGVLIQNLSNDWAYIKASATQPAASEKGTFISNLRGTAPEREILDPALELWVRAANVEDIVDLVVQELTDDAIRVPSSGGLPDKLFEGFRAMTTQNYTEANVKNGVQFGITLEASIGSSGTVYYSFKTPAGSNRISLKNRTISTDGGIRYTPRVGATFVNTATVVPIVNFNGNSSNVSGATAFLVDTVSDQGTPFDVVRAASSTGVGNTQQGIFAGDGIERILQPDTEYLLKFENLDAQERYVVYAITWYEGELDLPRP